jgi:HEAT repeat protein
MSEDENGSQLLIRLFEHTLSDDPKIRSAAYKALGNFEPEMSVISCLLNGLDDNDPQARRSAGASLIKFGYFNRTAMVV